VQLVHSRHHTRLIEISDLDHVQIDLLRRRHPPGEFASVRAD